MIKKGKEEIIYLLTRCIEKYKRETSQEIVLNTNRKNYESLAFTLSEISNKLPETAQALGHQIYEPDSSPNKKDYPFRKYDITGGQIKDALMGLVSNPRPYIVDTCYIYLYGIGRQAFEANPVDEFLVQGDNKTSEGKKDALSLYHENLQLRQELAVLQQEKQPFPRLRGLIIRWKRLTLIAGGFSVLFLISLIYILIIQNKRDYQWRTMQTDLNILPYQVSEMERRYLEGIWICYTGSPQARLSDTGRYHKVVANLIKIDYKNGYFLYNRFGASFNHTGYAQFEAPGLLSIHSKVKTNEGKIESPRHSLMSLDSTGTYLSAISASWNFDVGDRNRIIGIREAYKKLGDGGEVVEIINSLENASCQCKIIEWKKPDSSVEKFYLKNLALEELKDTALLQLIDEHSILLKNPKEPLVIERN